MTIGKEERKDFEVINGMKIPLRDNQKKPAPKRFYKSVFVEQVDGGFCVKLDQRILKSPERVALEWPSRDLAQRVAQEWDFQEERIVLHDMPMTTLSYSSIGRDDKVYAELRAEMLSYAGSDLIVYRSTTPRELVERQEQGWNPVLSWLEKQYGAAFRSTQGVGFVEQPQNALDIIGFYLKRVDDEHLPAMMQITKVSGSVFLAMAVRERFLEVGQAWKLAMIDEDWQNSQWGHDEAQKQKIMLMNRDFAAAADFIHLFRN